MHSCCFVPPRESALSAEEAELTVRRAFGWGSQRYWRRAVLREAPSAAAAQRRLHFLRDTLALRHADVQLVLRRFPEVLRLDMQQLRDAVALMQRNWPALTGSRLAAAVRDKPAVLGFDFDCEGDCQGECSRCWAQF